MSVPYCRVEPGADVLAEPAPSDDEQAEESILSREHHQRIRAEIDRRQSEAILQGVPVGIMAVDLGKRRITINRALMDMLDSPVAPRSIELPELRDPEGEPVPDDCQPARRAIAGEHVRQEEYLVVSRSDERIPVMVSAESVALPDGPVVGAVVSFQDITARKQLEQVHRDYVGLICHDLRAPLQSLMVALDIIAHTLDGCDRELARRAVQRGRQSARRMREMVDDLMVTAVIEAGKPVLDLQQTDVAQVFEDVVTATVSDEHRDRIRMRVDPALGSVRLDRVRIGRAVQNLVGNALEYGGDQPIDLGAFESKGHVELWVRDRGPGVPEENLPLLFEKYWASDRSRRAGGAGLGLYTCRLIAEAHGGRCGVENAERGARFWINLPVGGDRAPGAR